MKNYIDLCICGTACYEYFFKKICSYQIKSFVKYNSEDDLYENNNSIPEQSPQPTSQWPPPTVLQQQSQQQTQPQQQTVEPVSALQVVLVDNVISM